MGIPPSPPSSSLFHVERSASVLDYHLLLALLMLSASSHDPSRLGSSSHFSVYIWDLLCDVWQSQRDPAADSAYKTFGFSVTGSELRYLTAEPSSQRPVGATVHPDALEHGKGAERKRRRRASCREPARGSSLTPVGVCAEPDCAQTCARTHMLGIISSK